MPNYTLMPAALAGRSNLSFAQLHALLDEHPQKHYNLTTGGIFSLKTWQGVCLCLFPGPREPSVTERAFMELEIRRNGERVFLSETEGQEPGRPGKFSLAINGCKLSTEFFDGPQQRFWAEIHAQVLCLQTIDHAWVLHILGVVSRSPLIYRPSLPAELRQAIAA